MIFVIPLRSQQTSVDWDSVCLRLKSTIDSILNQQVFSKKIEIVISGHEKPYFLEKLKYQNVHFISVPFDIPKEQKQYMLDKLNKKKFASIFVKNHLLEKNKEVIIMQLDADDILHPEFVSNIEATFLNNKMINDICLMSGYTFDFKRRKLAYLNGEDKVFYRNCGSSFISRVTEKDLPSNIEDSCYFNYLADHVRFPEIAIKNNRHVYEFYYPGVMYLVNHGSNDVSGRENGENIIRSFIDTYEVEIVQHPIAITMINQV